MLVLDASVTMSWLFDDQQPRYGAAALDAIAATLAVVPGLWGLEVANVLTTALRKGAISNTQKEEFLALLESLPVQVEATSNTRAWREVLDVAVKHRLTAYDAAYLELAQRFALPIASLDQQLLAATRAAGVAVFASEMLPR